MSKYGDQRCPFLHVGLNEVAPELRPHAEHIKVVVGDNLAPNPLYSVIACQVHCRLFATGQRNAFRALPVIGVVGIRKAELSHWTGGAEFEKSVRIDSRQWIEQRPI